MNASRVSRRSLLLGSILALPAAGLARAADLTGPQTPQQRQYQRSPILPIGKSTTRASLARIIHRCSTHWTRPSRVKPSSRTCTCRIESSAEPDIDESELSWIWTCWIGETTARFWGTV